MAENIYTTEYYELFAKNLLETMLSNIFNNLQKGEKPDLFQENMYGVEITRVGNPGAFEIMGVWNANAGKKRCDISAKNLSVLEQLNPQYNTEDELVCISPSDQERRNAVDVRSAIVKKVERLNSADFNSNFQCNCLFVKYEDDFHSVSIEQIISIFNSAQHTAPKKFDYLFIWDGFRLHSYYNSDVISLELLNTVQEKTIKDQNMLKNKT